MKLSILDQSPLIGDATPAEALKQTVELAKQAEKWGYHRFWVSESSLFKPACRIKSRGASWSFISRYVKHTYWLRRCDAAPLQCL